MKMETLQFANHKNEIERQIIVLLVSDILAENCSIAIDNGCDDETAPTADAAAVFNAMSKTDRDDIWVFYSGERVGGIRLIYGNGCDVVSDYSTTLSETLLARAGELAARFRG